MIHRINKGHLYYDPYPNSNLLPDSDLIKQIHQTALVFPHSSHTFIHIMGHQNNHWIVHTLSLQGQANIHADEIARQF